MIRILSLPLLFLASVTMQDPPPFQIAVDVRLVVLHAIVRDTAGVAVPNLRQRDFQVFEDGVRQSIRVFRHEDLPVTAGIVVDHSGSMRGKLPDVVAAARGFVRSSSEADQMFVVNFNEKATLGLPPGMPFTNRPDVLARAIASTPADGQTALYDAIAKGLERLDAGDREKKVLVVISDGGDNVSTHTLRDISKLAERSSAVIYTIGIFESDDEDRNPGVLKHLAQASGGEAFFPAKLRDIGAVCERIAHDIRSQYTIGYFPIANAKAKPGARRAIRVTAHDDRSPGKLAVRTRTGYVMR